MTRFTVIAPFPPEAQHGGAALLRGLFRNLPSSVELGWLSLVGRSSNKWKIDVCREDGFFLFRALHSYRFARFRCHFNKLMTSFEILFFAPLYLLKLRRLKSEYLIIYCHPHFFHIYEYLIKKTNLPYHLTIHDDPVVATELNSSIGISASEAEEKFKKILKNAKSVDVITQRMADKYLNDYGVSSVVITNGWDFFEKVQKKINLFNVQIISTGNAWSTELKDLKDDNVQYFLEAIESEFDNVSFHIITPWFPYENKFSYVKRWNFLNDKEYDELLAHSHIGYAYDPFLKSIEEFSKFSFPSKIIGYLCKGLPFIYHGPKGSTVEDLLKDFNAGIIVPSNNREDIICAIKKITENYDSYCLEATRAWRERFDLKIIQSKYWDSILKN